MGPATPGNTCVRPASSYKRRPPIRGANPAPARRVPRRLAWPRHAARKEQPMNLAYAIERLYQTGWSTFGEWDLDHLPDGRAFPSLLAVQREFARAGLELAIKHNLM